MESTLRERFGLPGFRPGQREVMAALLERGAALAVFPTGGGKSLCYQLPALLLEGVTVVVSPLIALMKDQIDYLRGLGIDAARLDSSLTAEEARGVERRLRSGALRLLYVAPERFNNERFLELLRSTRIALFAVDEAHCISEWGHNFRPDYLKLAEVSRALGAERVLALTATATPPVVEDVCASFGILRECAVVTGFHRPNLRLVTSPTPARERDTALRERLRTGPPGPGIVYVTLQRTAERVAQALADAGLPARAYHAGMDDEARAAVQEWWKGSDRATVVATIAFGMGIDKADVRYVYHYNLPKGLESWVQEIGRAGRDGRVSTVEVLGGLEDVATLENFTFGDTPTPGALRGLLREVLEGPREFDVSLYTLSAAHDMRPLVLRTALTYLELTGVLRQGTPFYAGYRVRLRDPLPQVTARFPADRARFVERVFAGAKKGREWYTLDPAAAAASLGEERDRIVRMVDYLAQEGLAEVQATDARQRYTRLANTVEVETLAAELEERFARREAAEVGRVRRVVEVIGHDGCQTNALLAHFGEVREAPCGHCSWCETGRATVFPPLPEPQPVERALDAGAFRRLVGAHPDALGEARQ
ncbi:MAG: RecQ family ATP-dependent DNA helicase, partial [Gemmatimonadota bacterium]|nr:RecQ family ATP-dependent DNA helicase [Gemmatimonadota bacterium]